MATWAPAGRALIFRCPTTKERTTGWLSALSLRQTRKLLCRSLRAVRFEGAGKFLRDSRGGRGFDSRALHQVDELTVAEERDGRRRRRIALEVAAGAVGGFAVLAGEDGDRVVGLGGVLQCETHSRAHLAGGAAADRVHYDHCGSGLVDGGVDFFGGAGFGDAGAGKFFAHRDDHHLWVHFCCLLAVLLLFDCTG